MLDKPDPLVLNQRRPGQSCKGGDMGLDGARYIRAHALNHSPSLPEVDFCEGQGLWARRNREPMQKQGESLGRFAAEWLERVLTVAVAGHPLSAVATRPCTLRCQANMEASSTFQIIFLTSTFFAAVYYCIVPCILKQ